MGRRPRSSASPGCVVCVTLVALALLAGTAHAKPWAKLAPAPLASDSSYEALSARPADSLSTDAGSPLVVTLKVRAWFRLNEALVAEVKAGATLVTTAVGQKPGWAALVPSGMEETIHGVSVIGPDPPAGVHPVVFGPAAQPHQLPAAGTAPVEAFTSPAAAVAVRLLPATMPVPALVSPGSTKISATLPPAGLGATTPLTSLLMMVGPA